MANYLKEARQHAEKIEYYRMHAGSNGYSQAQYHYRKLEELQGKASKSKHNKNDVPVINTLIVDAHRKMVEMRNREGGG